VIENNYINKRMKELNQMIGFVLLLCMIGCCKQTGEEKGRTSAVFNPDKTYGTVTDIDGNIYKTIKIGNQTWMAENLRTTHYQNGDPIPNIKAITDPSEWGSQTSGAYCSYKNTSDLDSIATFGLLYNGYAIMDPRNIAPAGWHVPTDAEWDTLINYVAAGDAMTDSLGVTPIVGGRLKETGTLHWVYPTADNSSGFTALPIAYRNGGSNGYFQIIGVLLILWTSSRANYAPGTDLIYIRTISAFFSSTGKSASPIQDGNGVRCLRNN
jgi:uncharacterized protein (TIGR02145 family)